ncbi:unnamed protein product [Meganyctiphanes norvegica]|uniref:Sulfotransferase domain-containing protein n=1 Tax=Meganyctiphanes norvegica TaxID=48144 RepID=A0AAV2RN83_MEGNR
MKTSIKLRHEFKALPEDIQKEITENFSGYRPDGVGQVKLIGEDNDKDAQEEDINANHEWRYLMPMNYNKHSQKYYNFQFRQDDVIVMTHPKCGTTWMLEIVWLMKNKLDIKNATAVPQRVRCPMIEQDSFHSPGGTLDPAVTKALSGHRSKTDDIEGEEFLALSNLTTSPRTLKTHLPLCLLNPSLLNTSKVIYVARNPRDVCVSYYHHHRLIRALGFTGDFTKFVDFWCRDLLIQGPYWQHVGQGWEKHAHPNVHFVFYEDLKKNSMTELQKINKFLNTNLSEEELNVVKDFTNFDQMKIRKSINPMVKGKAIKAFKENEGQFLRKGTIGDWKNYFTPETEHKFQAWLDKWSHIKEKIPFTYEMI